MLDKFLVVTKVENAIMNAERISVQYEKDEFDRLDRDHYTEVHNLIKDLELDK